MDAENKNKKPLCNFQNVDVYDKLNNNKNNLEDGIEIKEVDDKLIGDDLEINEAQQGQKEADERLENKNNY